MIDYYPVKWPVRANIHALTTTRTQGFSTGRYASLNLAEHVNDERLTVRQNRASLARQLYLKSPPKWLNQTHSTKVIQVTQRSRAANADGSYTTQPNCVCAVLTADCLPVFIADTAGQCVGVFHAGWRGLANGIISNAVQAMRHYSTGLIGALGPAISQDSFEVGAQVRQQFLQQNPANRPFFKCSGQRGHYLADLYGMAKLQLLDLGVKSVWQDESLCTFKDQRRFYSYRRDGQTGRMASLIWFSR